MFSTRLFRTCAVVFGTAGAVFAQWNLKAPATSPAARVGAAMDFVPLNGGLVMFGGSGNSPILNNETWVYDGVNWAQLAPATSPTARSGAQLVYDPVRGVAVLYGGLASAISIPPPTNQTWEFDGATWTQAAPTANAGNRYQYGACYDLLRSRVVMYGGATTQMLAPPNNQTWEYDGTTWTLMTTTGNPGPRGRPAMCFHLGIGKAVMFGGNDASGLSDQTWLYDGVAGTWTQVAMAGVKPSARNAATMVYDSARNVCVMTGGQDSAGPLGDTWTFDGSSWRQQSFATQAVRDHSMGYLPFLKQAVKFGGFVSAPFVLSNQTSEFGTGVYGVGCAGTAGVPTMAAVNAPVLGQAWTVNVGNLEPVFSVAILAFGFFQLPGIDLGFIDMPGCAAYTTADILIPLSGAGGAASWVWPAVSGFAGDGLFGQAFCLDPGVNNFGFTISNAVYLTISL